MHTLLHEARSMLYQSHIVVIVLMTLVNTTVNMLFFQAPLFSLKTITAAFAKRVCISALRDTFAEIVELRYAR